jgi:hypothetical protein
VQWAMEEFREALIVKDITSSTFTVIVSSVTSPLAKTCGNLPSITALIPGIWAFGRTPTSGPIALSPITTIIGLTPEIHAIYCREDLAAVLKACPQISGLTRRIHGEAPFPRAAILSGRRCIPQNSCDVTVHSRLLDRILIGNAIASLLCERIDFHQHLDFWRPSCFSSHATISRLSMKTEAWWEPSVTQAAQQFPGQR